MAYDESYYAWNGQAGDRPALWFYSRLARRYFANGRVLDFGSGTGFLLRRLSRYFLADGFEVSAHAKENSELLHSGIRIFDELAHIQPASYSGITALHVFEHIDDKALQEVFATFRNILLPGGRILCVVPERDGLGHIIKGTDWCGFKDPTHVNLKNFKEWSSFFRENGFAIVKAGTDGLWDFPYSRKPRYLDILQHSWLTIIQFFAGRLILSVSSGESAVFILKRLS